jgi:hypothetical protein
VSHECEECGALCYCDQDDCLLPQPSDCRHVCEDPDDDLLGADDDEAPAPGRGGEGADG